MKKVDCVVVTYNRLNLLKECIQSILNQTYPVNHIYVVNNNSTDNTINYLAEIAKNNTKIVPINLTENVGGAGGFNIGIKKFIKANTADFVWIMDDDTIPQEQALENLIRKDDILDSWGFLCSNVRWKDDSAANMNVPTVERDWNQLAKLGLIKVKAASFVSILFLKKIVEAVGYPISDFFIWGDDVEYTKRITKLNYDGYLVSDSLVEHKIETNITTDIVLEKDRNRIKRYFFANRNAVYTTKKLEGNARLVELLLKKLGYEPLKILFKSKDYKLFRLKYSLKGTLWGLFYNPKTEKY